MSVTTPLRSVAGFVLAGLILTHAPAPPPTVGSEPSIQATNRAKHKPKINVIPSPRDFGALAVGEFNRRQVDFRNPGSTDLTLSWPQPLPAPYSWFGAAPSSVPAGGGALAVIEYAPTTVGLHSWDIPFQVADPDGRKAKKLLKLRGRGISPIKITPRPINFGKLNLAVRNGDLAQFSLKNVSSTQTFDVLLTLQGRHPQHFEVSHRFTAGVVPGEVQYNWVVYAPDGPGNHEAKLTVQIPDIIPGGFQTSVKLTGTAFGKAMPMISATPPYLYFGRVPVGRSAEPKTVTLTNNTESTLVVDVDIHLPSGFTFVGNPPLRFELEPWATSALSIGFQPNAKKYFSGPLKIRATGGPRGRRQELRVPLVGDGEDPGEIVVYPRNIDFGEVELGGESEIRWVAVENRTPESVTFRVPVDIGNGFHRLADPPEDPIEETFTLQPGGQRSLPFQYRPLERADKAYGDFKVTPQALGHAPVYMTLMGKCFAPRMEVQPADLDFGEIPLETEPGPRRTLEVSNTGNAPLEFTLPALDPAEGFAWVGIQAPASFELEPNTSRQFEIEFLPTDMGYALDFPWIEGNDPESERVRLTLESTAIEPTNPASFLVITADSLVWPPFGSKKKITVQSTAKRAPIAVWFEFKDWNNPNDIWVAFYGLPRGTTEELIPPAGSQGNPLKLEIEAVKLWGGSSSGTARGTIQAHYKFGRLYGPHETHRHPTTLPVTVTLEPTP